MDARLWLRASVVSMLVAVMVAVVGGGRGETGVVVREAPRVSPGATVRRVVPVAPVSPGSPEMPVAGRDVVLASVSARVDDGPEQLGPEFVADLADNPRRLTLRALVVNDGSEGATVQVDLVNRPHQLVRALPAEPVRLEAGHSRVFEVEYRLRDLYRAKMTEIPFAVGAVVAEDYGDEMPANNVLSCRLIPGRPDVVVTQVRVEPHIEPGSVRRPPDGEAARFSGRLEAFVTIENRGRGRLPEGSAGLNWVVPLIVGPGGPVGLPPIGVPALRPGEAMTMRLLDPSRSSAMTEGRLAVDLLLQCTPRAGDVTYDEEDGTNNRRTFDIAYRIPDVFGYHPYRGLDYDNR
jgi:hypothetical protein